MSESRKLAAILAADVVGFSRLNGADEERTLARLRALRSDLMDPTLRLFLVKAHGQFIDWPKPTDTVVLENYITNYKPLGDIIDDFNSALSEVEKQKFMIERSVVDVRDAIAHGRVVTWTDSFPAMLWKFGRPKDGKVPASCITLTKDWLIKTSNNIKAQQTKALECFKARGYEGLS